MHTKYQSAPTMIKVMETVRHKMKEKSIIIASYTKIKGAEDSASKRLSDAATRLFPSRLNYTLATTLEKVFTFNSISTFLYRYNRFTLALRFLVMRVRGVGRTEDKI